MKPENLDIINKSFEIQAENFESRSLNFTKEDYLNYTINSVEPQKEDIMLEVASGTCICGRSFAPNVKNVVCLDATESMLKVGKKESENQNFNNMIFVKGCAEELPFLDNSFDIVFSRLAFHHFVDTNKVFAETVRVLKPNGKLVMIDMESAEESLRETEDRIETMRDPSHVKNLSKKEMYELFEKYNITTEKSETKEITQHLTNWMSLTKTPKDVQEKITELMKNDIEKGEKTGFYPYYSNGEICFNHRWVLTLGRKG